MKTEVEALGRDFLIQTNSWANSVRVVHLPSGLAEVCDKYLSQYKNKEAAAKALKERLLAQTIGR